MVTPFASASPIQTVYGKVALTEVLALVAQMGQNITKVRTDFTSARTEVSELPGIVASVQGNIVEIRTDFTESRRFVTCVRTTVA